MNIEPLVEAIMQGKDPVKVIDEQLVSGPDRSDDIKTPDDAATVFAAKANEIAGKLPYVDSSWLQTIATQLRSGASAAELADMALRNRDQYAGTARIDAGGDFDTWDTVYHALLAVPTEVVPFQVGNPS